MRVLFLNYEYPPLGGGAANATAYLLSEYSKAGNIVVDLVTSSPDEQQVIEVLGEDVQIHKLNIGKKGNLHHQSQLDLLRYSYKAYAYADGLLQANDYDVVHAFFGVPCGALAMRLSKKYRIPYIVSLRGSDVPGYSERFAFLYNFLRPLIVRVWKRAFQVISNSQGLKDLALLSAPEQAIGIIPNGVDTERFRPGQAGEEWIITAGATRLTQRKGLHLIIEALPKLLTYNPKVVFEIMGDGASEEMLRAKALALGVAESVRFLGRIPASETVGFYQRAKVFVLPSANEGMSNALLEALACGLPAVVTDTGGSSELVREKVNGLVIERTVGAIEESLMYLLAHEEERARMGRESRVCAEAKSWTAVAEAYQEVYQEATRR
ncbi:MAG: glycosyltransferase [Candidatus Moranbacteria bacterium]|nr:glycosyltransferase [Candidatus Moranbacteria bacterium]